MISCEPVVVFIQRSDKSDQKVPRKFSEKRDEPQTDVTDGKKTKSFWHVLVRKGLAPLALSIVKLQYNQLLSTL